ncbi:MAG: zf-HC2 domain-containing protein [Sedimentisphaerales bacterium]
MKEQICRVVSEEELVAYVEGDVPPSRAERIAAHVAICQNCRTMLDALERSLHVTQAVWQTGEAQWPKTLPLEKSKSSGKWFRPVTAVAASVLLILGVGVTWRLLSEPSKSPHLTDEEPSAAEIDVAANRAAMAAEMLAVADLLSSQPGGQQYAVKRYNDVIASFPGTDQSAEARRHLQSLLERR